ncbi:MAG: hypothetical protein WA151_04600 [Desulfatirhabdiaceae bacterium]
MPRQSRIDAPGAIRHVIGREINRQKIFRDYDDRRNFLDRLATLLTDSGIRCLAWAMLADDDPEDAPAFPIDGQKTRVRMAQALLE